MTRRTVDGPGAGSAPPSLGLRLGVALVLVVVAGAVTLLVVALLVAPSVFQGHLDQVLTEPLDPRVREHVDEAFANAVLVALGVAVPVALLTALAVTWVVARQITRALGALVTAAQRIAAGDLRTRVEPPGIGAELVHLTAAFNTMAERLAETESTRRRMIGDLAHELRTPLAALEATVDAVSDGVLPADGTTMATLHDQTDRLSRLVADMAAVSRAEERELALDVRDLDLGDLARDAVASHAARFAAAHRRLVLERPDTGPRVRADAARLHEALGNLLDNALEHTSPGGEAAVQVGTSDGHGTLRVTDDGRGFDPADAEHLFERFYRGDPSRTDGAAHSGVGLTIARAIVEAHGGHLTAASDGPGTGASFMIALPGSEPHARVRAQPR